MSLASPPLHPRHALARRYGQIARQDGRCSSRPRAGTAGTGLRANGPSSLRTSRHQNHPVLLSACTFLTARKLDRLSLVIGTSHRSFGVQSFHSPRERDEHPLTIV